MFNQTVKADRGKLQLSLVPMELVEAVAVVRMYGNAKYPDGGVDNWKQVEKQRYKDALFRHLAKYLQAPYGMDCESNLPHLFHLACNVAFLCTLEINDGTLPTAEEALKKMTVPDAVQGRGSGAKPFNGCIFVDNLTGAVKGAERC